MISCKMFLRTLLGLAVLLVWSGTALCFDLGTDRLRLRGFGTLAATSSGDDVLYYPTYLSSAPVYDDNVSFGESLLGFQLDGTLTDSLEASVQLIFRDRFDDALEESIERAFVRYTNNDWMVRAGRLGLDIYMLSEYRNVGFAYIWAHPSMEFYGPFTFDYFDGAEIEYTHQLSMGTLKARLYGGAATSETSTREENVESTFSPYMGGTLVWEQEALTTRISMATARFDSELSYVETLRQSISAASAYGWASAQEVADALKMEDTTAYYFSVGASYDKAPWIIQSELSYADLETEVWQSMLSGYISVGYVIGPVTMYSMGGAIWPMESRTEVSAAPQGLEMLQYGAQFIYDASSIEQQSISFGARWDVTSNIALKAQWDHTWVDEYGGGLWYKDTVNTESMTIDTFSLNLSYMF